MLKGSCPQSLRAPAMPGSLSALSCHLTCRYPTLPKALQDGFVKGMLSVLSTTDDKAAATYENVTLSTHRRRLLVRQSWLPCNAVVQAIIRERFKLTSPQHLTRSQSRSKSADVLEPPLCTPAHCCYQACLPRTPLTGSSLQAEAWQAQADKQAVNVNMEVTTVAAASAGQLLSGPAGFAGMQASAMSARCHVDMRVSCTNFETCMLVSCTYFQACLLLPVD